MIRSDQITAFVSASGFGDWTFTPLVADASARRYLRGSQGETSVILMDAPPDSGEDITPFLDVSKMLHGFDLTAPKIIAEDAKAGFILMQDFGDNLVAHHCAEQPEDEVEIYRTSIDVLAELSKHPAPAALEPYDRTTYHREANLVHQWYLQNIDETARDAFAAALDQALDQLSVQNPVLVMRDYHAENLIWRAHETGTDRLGLLDYQDALAGHPAYDIVSLIEDARRPLGDGVFEATLTYASDTLGIERDTLRQDVAILGAQRNLKIIGIFARLYLRDGKPKYPPMIPHVWRLLQNDLAHPACNGLRNWCAAYLPEPTDDLIDRMLNP
ncbi:MAG: phosphotransferase [Pseudomonadota bacterium]